MKKIYIINGIFNMMLGMMGGLPFVLGYMLCKFATDNTMIYRGIGMLAILIIAVIILNFILYIILNKFIKKEEDVIRKRLYILISLVMFLFTLLLSTAYVAFM